MSDIHDQATTGADSAVLLIDAPLPDPASAPPEAPLESMTLRDVEGWLVRRAMARFGGNVSHAARALGLSRSALYRRLERHGL